MLTFENDEIINKLLECETVTGGHPVGKESEYTFKSLICPNDLYKQFVEHVDTEYGRLKRYSIMEMILSRTGNDFLIVDEVGEVNFAHISDASNMQSILENGITPSSDWVGDIGYGVYTIDNSSFDGWDNVRTYFSESYVECDLLIVEGTYSGPYRRCVIGDGHDDYILMPESINKECITDAYTQSINEFLY